MKRCPLCRRDYSDETLNFCLDDGTPLVDGPALSEPDASEAGSSPSDESATAVMGPPSTGSRAFPEEATRQYSNGSSITSEFKRNKYRATAVLVAALILLAGFGYGIFKFLERSAVNKPERPVSTVTVQRLTGDGRTRMPAISPDGKFLVYLKLDQGQESLWIKQIQTGSSVNVVKPGEASRFFGITFSPDGNFVYFNATMNRSDRPTVYRAPTLGGTPVKFLSDALFLQFSPDGKQISFRRENVAEVKESIYVANADGANEREIAVRQGKQFVSTAAAWSPDGKLLAVGIGDDDLGPSNTMFIGLIDVATGTLKEFGSQRWDVIDDIVWHPSGDSLIMIGMDNAFTEGQVVQIAYPSGEPRQLTNDLNGHYSVSITSDGNAIVTGERYARSAVWVSPDLKAENAKQVMPSTGDTWGLSWTPDGRIVYASDQSGDVEVWVMNSDGSDARQLTHDRIFKSVPTVSPDGKFIVYVSSQNGGQIVRVNIDGSDPHVLTRSVNSDNPHISLDSRWVIYSAIVDGVFRVMRVPIDGGEEKPLIDQTATEPRYSNDGTRVACFLFDEKSSQWSKLAIFPAEGGAPISTLDVPPETNESRGPVWTPDDKGITLVVAPGEKQNLWLLPVDGSPGHAMTNFDSPGTARRDYSRDGKRIAVVRAEGIGNAIMITNFR